MSEFNSLGGQSYAGKQSNNMLEECKDSLLSVIEKQIIPRLLNAQQFFHASTKVLNLDGPVEAQPEFLSFTEHCIKGDPLNANAVVDALMGRGLTHDRIFLELITPSARHLGVMWEQDLCDFTQVTCGLALMHQITYRLGYEFQSGPQDEGDKERVMLACAPGSQHFLGLTIVADFFRNAGSEVVLEISSTRDELVRAVANEWFDVIGISVAIESQLQSLPLLIQGLRERSGNPNVRIVLGGPIFLVHELSPKALGADAIFTDAREAVTAVKRLVRAK